MKEGWTTRWKALLIWLCGYLNIVALALTGGYVIVKSENEELRREAKKAFFVTVIFTLISMFFTLYSDIGSMASDYYSSAAYTAYSVMTNLVSIAKVIVFVVFGALAFFKGGRTEEKAKAPAQEEEKSAETQKEEEAKI